VAIKQSDLANDSTEICVYRTGEKKKKCKRHSQFHFSPGANPIQLFRDKFDNYY
jgi:hypothetical protein